jgi:hypothetical protein
MTSFSGTVTDPEIFRSFWMNKRLDREGVVALESVNRQDGEN